MLSVPNLELHVTHTCNLTCESCSHYANQGHHGHVSLDQARSWMEPWRTRLTPKKFSLLGGEPTIHPDLLGFIDLAREMWPQSHLRLVTNGFFLHRHPELPKRVALDGNIGIYLSIHHDSAEYRQKLAPILSLIQDWETAYGIRVQRFESFRHWTRRYHGEGAQMLPYDDALPRKSWEACPARYCPQLFDGKLWKCGPLAYLGLHDRKFPLSSEWRPYLGYQPLAEDCTDDALRAFFSTEEIPECGMCAAAPAPLELPLPLPKVRASRPV